MASAHCTWGPPVPRPGGTPCSINISRPVSLIPSHCGSFQTLKVCAHLAMSGDFLSSLCGDLQHPPPLFLLLFLLSFTSSVLSSGRSHWQAEGPEVDAHSGRQCPGPLSWVDRGGGGGVRRSRGRGPLQPCWWPSPDRTPHTHPVALWKQVENTHFSRQPRACLLLGSCFADS